MGDNRGVNPLFVGLGIIAGAAGALFFSKKENRSKTMKAIRKATKSKQGWMDQAKQLVETTSKDLEAFASQDVDKPLKPKRVIKKKK